MTQYICYPAAQKLMAHPYLRTAPIECMPIIRSHHNSSILIPKKNRLDKPNVLLLKENFKEDGIFLHGDIKKLKKSGIQHLHEFHTDSGFTKINVFMGREDVYLVVQPNDCRHDGGIQQELGITNQKLTTLQNQLLPFTF